MTSEIDLTPAGAQTPEGVARIEAASKKLEEASLLLSRTLQSISPEIIAALRALARGESARGTVDPQEAQEIADEVEQVLKQHSKASNEFLAAVAGR